MAIGRKSRRRSDFRLVVQTGWRWWKLALIFVALAGWVYLLVAGEGGLLELRETRRELADLEARVARLAAENDSLSTVLYRLENDPAYLEKVAREDLGMVKPGERLYRLREPAETGDR